MAHPKGPRRSALSQPSQMVPASRSPSDTPTSSAYESSKIPAGIPPDDYDKILNEVRSRASFTRVFDNGTLLGAVLMFRF